MNKLITFKNKAKDNSLVFYFSNGDTPNYYYTIDMAIINRDTYSKDMIYKVFKYDFNNNNECIDTIRDTYTNDYNSKTMINTIINKIRKGE